MKTIVLSGINFFEGGPLSVYKDLLNTLLNYTKQKNWEIVAFVHKKELFCEFSDSVELIELPKARRNYINRLWYEYVFFYLYSRKRKIDIWFSLHDITPNVKAKIRLVYCHNPTPFLKPDVRNVRFSPMGFLSSLLYKYVYQINIHKNNAVVVQQDWIRREFNSMFRIKKIIVARPNVDLVSHGIPTVVTKQDDIYRFIFPSYPRFFKNFEVLCAACQLLENKGVAGFEVLLTIDGTENRYAKSVVTKYRHLKNLKFIGLQERTKLFELYGYVDCMVFPSKLETWGLPVSEFKETCKPIIISQLPYAKETIGTYDKAIFFNQNSSHDLSVVMENIMKNNCEFKPCLEAMPEAPYAENWNELIDFVFNL